MSKKIIALLLVMVMVLGLAACGGSDEGTTTSESNSGNNTEKTFTDGYPQNYLRYVNSEDPSTLDVMLTTGDYMVPLNIYDTLVESTCDDEGNASISPALAESWTVSDDGLTYTFTLRKGVLFHNGEELKASDVEYSVYRMMDPERDCVNTDVYDMIVGASEYLNGEADSIEGLKVIDDYTFSYTLEQPYAPFLSNLAVPGGAIYNQKACDLADEAAGGVKTDSKFGVEPEYTIGTGPFQVTEWVTNDHITLVRNNNYWKDSVPEYAAPSTVEGIVLFTVGDSSTMKMMFDNGDIDIFDLDNCREAIGTYRADATLGSQVVETTRLGTYYYCLNQQVEGLDNVLVRKAIQRVIDRQALLDSLYYGTGIIANSILAPGVVGYSQLPEIEYDVAAAQDLMTQAGYSESNMLHLEISQSSTASSTTLNINEAVQQMLKQIYIDAEIVQVDDATWSSVRSQGGMDMYQTSWSADFNDPDNFIYTFFSHANAVKRGFNYNNEEVMDKVEEARFMTDTEARLKLYSELEEQIVYEDAVWVPLFHLQHVFVLSTRVNPETFTPNWAGWSSMCFYTLNFNK
ncbi:MAG: ABC transporter substrate-binding protein [Clostridia bacterium]|nr:ABC transporter substrate-binding protein [Clostridia bacterium]